MFLKVYNWVSTIIQQSVAVICSKFLTEHCGSVFKIWYPYGTQWYQCLVPINKSTNLIDDILDDQNQSVYKNLQSVLGPHENFNMTRVTPHHLGYKYLRFDFLDDTSKSFGEHDVIDI